MRRRLASTCMAGSWIPTCAGMTDTRWIPTFAGMTDASGDDNRPTGLFDQDDRDVVDVGAGRRDTNEVAQLVEEVVGVVVLKEG